MKRSCVVEKTRLDLTISPAYSNRFHGYQRSTGFLSMPIEATIAHEQAIMCYETEGIYDRGLPSGSAIFHANDQRYSSPNLRFAHENLICERLPTLSQIDLMMQGPLARHLNTLLSPTYTHTLREEGDLRLNLLKMCHWGE